MASLVLWIRKHWLFSSVLGAFTLIVLYKAYQWSLATGANIPLIGIGIIVTYLSAILRYTPPPFKWVVEMNFPWSETIKLVWSAGLHFLWLPIRPFMYVRNKLFCADKKILVTIGVDDGNPGNPALVEFQDTSAGVRTQVVLRVIDPLKATYEVNDYEAASLNKVEANFRKLLSKYTLDEAMGNVDIRSKVATAVFVDVNKAIKKWGVQITNYGKEITIIEFIPQPKTLEQREKVIAAEKDAVAKVKTAQATKKATILEKQGQAKGIELVAEAEGKAAVNQIKFLADYLEMPKEKVLDYLLKQGMLKSIDGSTIIATSEAGLLNTPISLAQTLFAIDSARSGQNSAPAPQGGKS